MAGNDTEKDIAALENRAKAELHYGDRWLPYLIGGAIVASCGMFIEGFYVHLTSIDLLVRDDNTLSLGGALTVWVATVSIPLVRAVWLHRGLRRLPPKMMVAIDVVCAVLAIVSILALPLLLAKANGIGIGNLMDLVPTADPMAETGYFVAALMRLPVILLMALGAALGIETVLSALRMRADNNRRRLEVLAAADAQADLAEGLRQQQTRRDRLDSQRREMRYGFARAMSTAVEAKAKQYQAYVRGEHPGGKSFADLIDEKMKRGLSGYRPEVIDLVEAHMPIGVDFDALPVSSRDLCDEDRTAIAAHAMWLRRTFTTTQILNNLKDNDK